MRFILAAATALFTMPAFAQDSVFDSYDAMRSEMDTLLMTRQIEDLMLRFGGADEMTPQQLATLDSQVEQIFPRDLEQAAVLRRQELDNGFAQELVAYWTGLNYIYAYVFYHERDGRVVSINYRFNTDFIALNNLF